MEVVAQIQGQLLKCSTPRGSTPQRITWTWVCVKLLNLLSNYPSGVTEAIILAELYHELQSTGGKLAICKYRPQKKVTVSSVLDSRSADPESVLVVHAIASHDVPGTTTKIIQLEDCDGDCNRYIEMYLHRKFYDITHTLTTHTLRMTYCRLVPSSSVSQGKQRKASLRLLPTEHMAIVLDSSAWEQWQSRFIALGCLEHDIITQPDYIQSVYAKVMEVGVEEVVHSPDGSAFKRLIVELADIHVVSEWTVQLILWDSYVAFVRLFDKGDVLYLERPYAKPTPGGSFYLEHGPATIVYLAPFEPTQEIVPSQHPSLQSVTVKKTDDGKLDFTTYPERLTVMDIPPNMINGVLCAVCQEIGRKEFLASDGGLERFTVLVDDHTGSISVVVLDPGHGIFEKIYCRQCLVLVGLSSCADKDGLRLPLMCDLSKGAAIYNVSSLPGLLSSPCLCSNVTLDSSANSGRREFTTVARLVRWYCVSEDVQPVEPVHCSCRKRVKENHGVLSCHGCSVSSLVELQTDVEQKLRNLSDESQRWRWQFSLGAVLQDGTGSIQAQITSTAAEDLLQRSPSEFTALSASEQQSLLDSCCSGGKYTFCISVVSEHEMDAVFQINAVYIVQ